MNNALVLFLRGLRFWKLDFRWAVPPARHGVLLRGSFRRIAGRATSRPRYLVVCAISVLVLAPIAGCGRGSGHNTAHVEGTVTIAGQPIPTDAQASITFQGSGKGQARGTSAQIVQGHYESSETPVGKVKVYFNIQQPTGKMLREGVGAEFPEYRSLVAPQFSQGIDAQITGDTSSQDFDLDPS